MRNDPIQEIFDRHNIDDPIKFLEDRSATAGVVRSKSVQVPPRGNIFLMLGRLISLRKNKKSRRLKYV